MADEELQAWSQAWTSAPAPEAGLSAIKRKDLLMLRLIVGGDLLGCISCLALALFLVFARGDSTALVVAMGMAVLTVTGFAFLGWNWRGLWADAGGTVRAYLATALARHAARRRWLAFCWWIGALEVVFFGGVILWRWRSGVATERVLDVTLLSLAITAAAAWALWWIGRKERRIGSELARMQADIDAED